MNISEGGDEAPGGTGWIPTHPPGPETWQLGCGLPGPLPQQRFRLLGGRSTYTPPPPSYERSGPPGLWNDERGCSRLAHRAWRLRGVRVRPALSGRLPGSCTEFSAFKQVGHCLLGLQHLLANQSFFLVFPRSSLADSALRIPVNSFKFHDVLVNCG